MATPDFILALREKIGTDPLWLSGVTAVVTHGEEVLMVRRADNGHWTPVTGIIDPGEQPAVAAEREVLEEAGVVTIARRLAWVQVTDPITYPNGDQSRFIDLVFACEFVSGDPHPADGENTEARWFPRTGLPAMSANMAERIRIALSDETATRFER